MSSLSINIAPDAKLFTKNTIKSSFCLLRIPYKRKTHVHYSRLCISAFIRMFFNVPKIGFTNKLNTFYKQGTSYFNNKCLQTTTANADQNKINSDNLFIREGYLCFTVDPSLICYLTHQPPLLYTDLMINSPSPIINITC